MKEDKREAVDGQWSENIKENMKKVRVSEEEMEKQVRWRTATRCSNP